MKEFDLFKVLGILTVVFFVIAAIGTMEFNGIIDDIEAHGNLPLELKNWHYFLLVFIIFIRKERHETQAN